jgi:hypothetical protein
VAVEKLPQELPDEVRNDDGCNSETAPEQKPETLNLNRKDEAGQMPEQVPLRFVGHLQLEETQALANARQMPVNAFQQKPDNAFGHLTLSLAEEAPEKPGHDSGQLPGDVLGQLADLIGNDHFDQPEEDRADLWRLEKDGDNCRARLRFDARRPSRPCGAITPAIAQRLADRPGKGRSATGRAAAERYGREAQHLADFLLASSRGRAQRKLAKRKR